MGKAQDYVVANVISCFLERNIRISGWAGSPVWIGRKPPKSGGELAVAGSNPAPPVINAARTKRSLVVKEKF